MTTDDQIIAAVREHGSNRKAALALGLNIRTVERRIQQMRFRGYAPAHDMTRTVPDGYVVKGTSTLYREDGSIAGQWVKSTLDGERRQVLMREAFEAAAKDLPPLKARKATGKWSPDVLAAYVLGDPHVGMRAWAEECGADWDLAIAESVHRVVIDDMAQRAEPAEQALLVNLGDMLHYDSMAPVTPRSGHMLDADGRYAKMIRVAVEVMVQAVESLLARHKRVHVINAIGNHDETGAQWLALLLEHRYSREPRVTVDVSPSVFTYYEWGANLIGIHHGHTCKVDKLPGVMATDRAEAWGRCRNRYWWTGHVHHEALREYPGVSVETFGTLAERDAYATAGGWRSRQGAHLIHLHKTAGEYSRLLSNPVIAGAKVKGVA